MSIPERPEQEEMQILYLMKATPFQEEAVVQEALPLTEPGRRERSMQMKDTKNRALSLAAGVLLSYAVNRWLQDCEEKSCGKSAGAEKSYQQMPCEKSIRTTVTMQETDAPAVLAFLKEKERYGNLHIPKIGKYTNGKPYFMEWKNLFFNLSHSGDYVACALSDCEIGVDIQQYRPNIKMGVLKKVLHPKEKQLFEAYGESQNERQKETVKEVLWKPGEEAMFYRIWAAKEAYSKYTGEGLSADFKKLATDFSKAEIRDERSGKIYRLEILEELENYAVAVVAAA